MAPFLNLVIGAAVGGFVVFLLVKTGPTLRQKKRVSKLEEDKSKLKNDKTSLQTRNDNLSQVIAQNQKKIQDLEENQEILSGQIIICLELLTGITHFQGQTDAINAQIVITKQLNKKIKKSFNSSEIYISND